MKAEETDLNGIVFLPLKNESGEEYANRIERWEAGEKVEGQSRTYAGNENNYMVIQGIEIEKKYFDIACERIEAAYAQGRLFA